MNHPKNYLFLSSTGRSGTTITRRSLGLHPQIYYNGQENNIVQDVISVAQSNCSIESRTKAMVVKRSEYVGAFRDLLTRLIWPDEDSRSRSTWMAAINPTGEMLDFLCEVFPSTRILCLIRNPIGMISSRMRYDSFKAAEFESHCHVWMRSQGVYAWCRKNPSNGRVFRHEWLYSTELETRLQQLFKWIDLEDAPNVAENMKSRLVHPTGDTAEINVLTDAQRSDYFVAKQDRWHDWTADNQQTFTNICGDFANELGYSIPF